MEESWNQLLPGSACTCLKETSVGCAGEERRGGVPANRGLDIWGHRVRGALWQEDSDWWGNWWGPAKALRKWAKWLGLEKGEMGKKEQRKNLQTENFGAGLKNKMLSILLFLLLNKKTTGFRGSVGNIQRTHRADTLWVPLKTCKKEGNQHFSAHETGSKLIIAPVLVLSFNSPSNLGNIICIFAFLYVKLKEFVPWPK